jgi:hypothetical protein
MDMIGTLSDFEQKGRYQQIRPALDEPVFNYFGLSALERALVRETVDVLMPSIRPRSFKSLDTPAQQRANPDNFRTYAETLGDALTSWRERTGGRGRFQVSVAANDPERAGPSGIVRVTYSDDRTEASDVKIEVNDDLVLTTLSELREAGLRTIPAGEVLSLVPDAHIWIDGRLYLVRPLSHRSWTVRQALRDAERIVRSVQRKAGRPQVLEVA